jgi:hypothetical protein
MLFANKFTPILFLLIALTVLTTSPYAEDLPKPGQTEALSCEAKLEKFIVELEELLNSAPRTSDPFHELIDRYFPLKRCDTQAILRIVRKSKYLVRVHETWKEYTFSFVAHGFVVGFRILKESGDSELPSASAMKNRRPREE